MSTFIAIFGAIFAFFVVVVMHEYGHFIVARWIGIKVLRFSIGFGKPLFSHRAKSGVEYVIGYLPLGGYVKMQDAFSQENTAENNMGSTGTAFEKKSVLARIAVVIAGPFANLILAAFLFFIVNIIGVTNLKPIIGTVLPNSIAARAQLKSRDHITQINHWKIQSWQDVAIALLENRGEKAAAAITVLSQKTQQLSTHFVDLQNWQFDPVKPDLLTSFGVTPLLPPIPPIIAAIIPNAPAAKSALQVEDRIVSINHQPIATWEMGVNRIERHPNQTVRMTIQRGSQLKILSVQLGERQLNGKTVGFLGVEPKWQKIPGNLQIHTQYSWYAAGLPALETVAHWVVFHLIVVKQLVLGKMSLKSLSGPVAIFQTAGSASLAGLTNYLQFIALISIVLGVLNLMPIPALDGGHLLFCLIEGVIRRPIPLRLQLLLINLGMILLISLMVYATSNDLIRLFQ